jgi:hypothetical protein
VAEVYILWCWMDMQGGECSGDGENADTQPDVPLLIYVRLRTPRGSSEQKLRFSGP